MRTLRSVEEAIKNRLRKIPAIQSMMPHEGVGRFKAEFDEVRDRIGDTDLERLFCEYSGPRLNKWLQYLPVYDRYLRPFRAGFPVSGGQARPVRMLEIGVFGGGSLKLWRSYFGAEATIFGIDINPECAQYNGLDGQVRIGSQADPDFLRQVVEEMGGVDIVLDDGSHVMEHIRASFEVLFPLLSTGGLYMVEDLHSAYWSSYGGGLKHRNSFIEDIKCMIDDMHHWYHHGAPEMPVATDCVTGLHVHDSIIAIDKQPVLRPVHVIVGDR